MANTIVRPTGLAGTWAGGAYTDINEASANDSNYIYSGDNANTTGSITFAAISNMATSGTCTIRLRHAESDGGVAPGDGTGNTASIQTIIVEGTTIWSTGATCGTSWQPLTVTFDASSITPSGTFQIDIAYNGGGGSPAKRRGIAISWLEFEYPVAAAAYTLPASVVSFSLSLKANQFLIGRRASGELSSYVLVGKVASLFRSLDLAGNTSVFSFNYRSLSLYWSFTLDSTTASYNIVGFATSLPINRVAEASLFSFTFTSNEASFSRGKVLDALQESFTLTAPALTLDITYYLSTNLNSYLLSGFDSTLTRVTNYQLSSTVQSYNLTSAESTLVLNSVLLGLVRPYSFFLADTLLKHSFTVLSNVSSYSLLNPEVVFSKGKLVSCVSATYDLVGLDVALGRSYIVSAETVSFSLTGRLASLQLESDPVLLCDTIALTFSYLPIAAQKAFNASTSPVVLNISSTEVVLTKQYVLLTNTAAFTELPYPTSLTIDKLFLCNPSSLFVSTYSTNFYRRYVLRADLSTFELSLKPIQNSSGRRRVIVV